MDRKIKNINFTNRTFGIEIEFTGFDTSKATRYLRENDMTPARTNKALFIKAMTHKVTQITPINIVDDGGYHNRRNQYVGVNNQTWFLKTDPTVSGMGFEFVSGIKSGVQGLREVKAVMDAMTFFKSTVNTSCGFHVHHGVAKQSRNEYGMIEDKVSLTATHFANLVTLYNTYSIGLSAMLPNSRTSSSSSYGSFNSDRDVDAITDHANYNSDTDRIRTLGRQVSRRAVYLNQGLTVEFRQHSGTTEADKVVNWIALTQAFVNETIRRVDAKSKGKAFAIQIPTRTVQNVTMLEAVANRPCNNVGSSQPSKQINAYKKYIVRNELKAMFTALKIKYVSTETYPKDETMNALADYINNRVKVLTYADDKINNKLFNIDPVKSIIRSVRRHTNANGQYIAKNRLQGQIYNAIKELLETTLYNEELPSVMELRKLIENKTAEITQSLQS